MFAVLQAGRAVAALMVVLFHLNGAYFGNPHYFPQQFSPLFDFGYAGVEFFFVLSGFVMAHAHWDELGRKGQARRFLWKRFWRIFPIYWAIVLPLIAAYLWIPSFGDGSQRDPLAIAAALTLAPAKASPILPVAWTLQHEILFYVLFSILIARFRIGVAVLGVWFGLCAAALALPSLPFPLSFLLSPYNLLFLFGMAAAWVVRTRSVPRPWLLAAAGLGLFMATGLQDTFLAHPLPLPARTLAYGTGAALMILGLVEAERSRGLKTPRPLRALGDASYSLYLVHGPALSFIAKPLFALGLAEALPRSIVFWAMLLGAVVAGLVVHLGLEKPLLRGSGRARRRGSAVLPAAARPVGG